MEVSSLLREAQQILLVMVVLLTLQVELEDLLVVLGVLPML